MKRRRKRAKRQLFGASGRGCAKARCDKPPGGTSITPIELGLVRRCPGRRKSGRRGGQTHSAEDFCDGGGFLQQGDEAQVAVAAGTLQLNAECSAKQVAPGDVFGGSGRFGGNGGMQVLGGRFRWLRCSGGRSGGGHNEGSQGTV